MASFCVFPCIKSRVCLIVRQLNQLRCFHAASVLDSKFRKREQMSTMEKMLSKRSKERKRTWYHLPTPNLVGSPTKQKRMLSAGSVRRAVQVSHVLYNYITQIVNAGELGPELGEGKVAISQVKVIPDFSSVNVYWMLTDTGDVEVYEKLLKQTGGKLRHLLMTSHALGVVPPITFVRDKSLVNAREVERLLKIADYGPEDFEISEESLPEIAKERKITHLELLGREYSENWVDLAISRDQAEVTYMGVEGHLQTHNLHVEYGQNKEISEKVNTEDKSINSDSVNVVIHPLESSIDHTSPKLEVNSDVKTDFRQDLYGLNQNLIMSKIVTAKQKSKRGRNLDDFESFTLSIEKENRKSMTGVYSKNLEKKKRKSGSQSEESIEKDIILKGLDEHKSSEYFEQYDNIDDFVDDFKDDYNSDHSDYYDGQYHNCDDENKD